LLEEHPLMSASTLAEHEEEEAAPEAPTGLTAEGLREIMDEQRRLSEENLARILQGPTRGQPLQEEIRAPGLSLEGLPHPSVDLDGFHKGLAERLEARDRSLAEQITQRATATAQEVSSTQALVGRAEQLIKEAAPDLDDAVIEFAAQKVANEMRSRGLDPAAELRSNTLGVAQMVLDYADEHFSGDTLTRTKASSGNGRTQVLGGAGRRGPAPKPRADDENSNIVSELRKMQTDLRLY
jgi:hypothetical protein